LLYPLARLQLSPWMWLPCLQGAWLLHPWASPSFPLGGAWLLSPWALRNPPPGMGFLPQLTGPPAVLPRNPGFVLRPLREVMPTLGLFQALTHPYAHPPGLVAAPLVVVSCPK
jgi:hypothetical protein